MVHRISIWGRMVLSAHRTRIYAVARMSLRGMVLIGWMRLREWRAIGRIGRVHGGVLGGWKRMHEDRTRVRGAPLGGRSLWLFACVREKGGTSG